MSSNSPDSQSDPIQIHWTDLLLAHPEYVPQFIIEISEDKWECRCGNTHDSEGFDPCDEFGEVVPAELGPWDGILYVCTRCWRVIDGNTLEILRLTKLTRKILNIAGLTYASNKAKWVWKSNKSTLFIASGSIDLA